MSARGGAGVLRGDDGWPAGITMIAYLASTRVVDFESDEGGGCRCDGESERALK